MISISNNIIYTPCNVSLEAGLNSNIFPPYFELQMDFNYYSVFILFFLRSCFHCSSKEDLNQEGRNQIKSVPTKPLTFSGTVNNDTFFTPPVAFSAQKMSNVFGRDFLEVDRGTYGTGRA